MRPVQAFIAMPFDQKFYNVYKAIRTACESLSIKVIRIDEVWARDDIYQQIEEEILNSDFVIADFTGDKMFDVANPNVVHEAAFARTKKKYLILMAQDHKCLPFDWRTRPAIIYQATAEGLTYLEERLVIGIKALMEKDDFGCEYEEAQSTSYNNRNFPMAPMAPMPPMQQPYMQQNQQNQQVSYTNFNTSLSEIESFLIAKQGQSVVVDTAYNARLPKGFTRKNDSIVCRIDNSEMVHIPATKFTMGYDPEEEEIIPHEVLLSEFLIDKYPVTNLQFSKFVEAGGYQYQGFWGELGWQWRTANKVFQPALWENAQFNDPSQPVVGVSWYEATAYATWSGKHLPTEAQWELAARGTDQRSYPWGDEEPTPDRANYRSVSKNTTFVTKYSDSTSFYGCVDMAGNIWEWCYDWYDEEYYSQSPLENPIGSPSNSHNEKVCRGGAWTYDIDTLKAYHRFFGLVTLRDKSSGFRCARIL